MRTASLCVGIVDYEHSAYGANARRLKFANTDARAFSTYLTSAATRTSSPGLHSLLLDHEALLPGLQASVDRISRSGELDLFVLYLAGHGEQGDRQGGWFCLADATPGSRSMDANRLAALLSNVRAHNVLVVVDCCHAEALLGGMAYFTSLQGGNARLFVASARSDQFAWEDDTLQRSVLSDVFLRACSTTSPIQGTSGTVRVESALFPYLRQQVPLLASAQKQGAVQEPVTGGTSCADLELPVIDSKSFGRALTVAQTVRRRLRQVLLNGALAALLLLVAVQSLTYHITADAGGRILVRPGLSGTYAVTPLALSTETDTGLRVEHLSRSNASVVSAIAQGKLWGVSSHLDEHGLRPWFSQLAPGLQTSVISRRGVLTHAMSAAAFAQEAEPPIEQALFLASLSGEAIAALAAKLYVSRQPEALACDSGRTLDFSVLNVPVEPYARDLWWQSLLTRGDGSASAVAVLSQVQNTAYRARGGKADMAVADLQHLALSLTFLQAQTAQSASLLSTLEFQLGTPCRSHAALALGLLATGSVAQRAEGILLAGVLEFDRDRQNDLATVQQELARHALELLAARRPLQPSTMEALGRVLIHEDPDLDRLTLTHWVLRAAAQSQPLPAALIAHLLKRLDAPEREHEFGHLAALELLARNVTHLPPDAVAALVRWVDANAKRLHSMSNVQVALGFVLAAQKSPRSDQIQLLVDQLSTDTYFPVPETSYRGELVVSSLGEDAGVALGRVMSRQALSQNILDRLVRLAIGRPDLVERQVIIDGLAARWYERAPDDSAINKRLVAARADGRHRELEVEVACTRLLSEPSSHREAVTAGLLRQWREESEPELRAAIASVVARSQWPRYGSMSLCGKP